MSEEIALIGICGGTGSGKTTLAGKLRKVFGDDKTCIIRQDDYYKDLSHLTFEQREKVNYDHPDAIDFALLVQNIKGLKAGMPISQPRYDFRTHTRADDVCRIVPGKIIILEGILLFSNGELRDLMDARIFLDTDKDLAFIRRLERDRIERGRTVDSVIRQYLNTVRPMYIEHVSANKHHADLVVDERYSINDIIQFLESKLNFSMLCRQKA